MFIREWVICLLALVLSTGCSKTVNAVDRGKRSDSASSVKSTVSLFAGSETDRGNADNSNPLQARFDHPRQLVLDGNILWVADGYSQSSLRKIDLASGQVSTAIAWNNFDGTQN